MRMFLVAFFYGNVCVPYLFNNMILAVLLSMSGIVKPTGAPIYVGSQTTNFLLSSII